MLSRKANQVILMDKKSNKVPLIYATTNMKWYIFVDQKCDIVSLLGVIKQNKV